MPSHTYGKMCAITMMLSWHTSNMPILPGRTGRPYRICDTPTPPPPPPPPSRQLARDMVLLYNAVHSQGVPNFCGARIPVSHQLHISSWRHYADRFNDPYLIDFLEFGFPLCYVLPSMPRPAKTNHASATRHPTHVDHYVNTVLDYGTLQGPFERPPFSNQPFTPVSVAQPYVYL